MIAALMSAVFGASEVILDKVILSKKKMGYGPFLAYSMLFIAIILILVSYIFGGFQISVLEPRHLFAFLGIICIGILINHFFFYSISGASLNEVEPLAMMHYFVTIIMATIFYAEERVWSVLIFAIIASLALIFSRIEKKHLKLNKYSIAMLGFVFFYALDPLFSKILLEVFSPIALYLLRCLILGVIFAVAFKKGLFKQKKENVVFAFLISIVTAVQFVAYYYSISHLGIVKTSLILILMPVIIFASSIIFLKEKINIKYLIADIIIIGCIVLAILNGVYE